MRKAKVAKFAFTLIGSIQLIVAMASITSGNLGLVAINIIGSTCWLYNASKVEEVWK